MLCSPLAALAAPENPLFPHRVQSWRANVLAQICGFAHVLSQAIQPLVASRYGRSFALLRRGRWWRAIRSPGYANPLAALPPPPHCSLSERSRHVEGLTALHDVVARPRQLVGHRLDGYHRQRAGALLLVEALDAFVVAHRKVRRFDEGPGQVPVAALGVAFSFFLPFDSRRLLTVRA